jgi:hypothetical protein
MKKYNEVIISIVNLAEDAIRTSGDNMLEDIWEEGQFKQ